MTKIKNYGPHGGTLIKTNECYVEISIFETDIPPRLRLYFYDLAQKPIATPCAKIITLSTNRKDGNQIFYFRVANNYLEATEILPEPHEFEAILNISHNSQEYIYRMQFTEDDHGHSHEDSNFGAHKHDNGTGIFSKIRKLFGHSHQIADKIDESMESNELGIKTLKSTLIILGITAIIQAFIVSLSGSVALLADTIHNVADAATSIPLWIAFSLARRKVSRHFTYGYGKVEDIAGVVIIMIIFFSACVAAYESITKFTHPCPMEHLELVALAAIIGFVSNEWVAFKRIRVGKHIGSAALVADGYHARIDGFTSLTVLFGVVGSWLGYPVIDSIIGFVITAVILFIVKDSAKSIWLHLIDGIEPKVLEEIEHAPMHVPGVRSVYNVRARWIGHRVYADVTLKVDPQLSIIEAHKIALQAEKSLCDHVRLLSIASVKIHPDEEREY